jgi:hypothetical protein
MGKIDIILPRLSGVRKAPARTGIVQAYRACCPAHQPEGPKPGRSPALSVAETEAGGVLLHCFAGCSADEIAGAAGVELTDLFPGSSGGGGGIPGGPAGWASAAALADAVADAAAEVTVGDMDAFAVLASAVERFRVAARAAMRKGVEV